MGDFKKNKYRFSTMSVVAEKGKEIDELREKESILLIKELYSYKILLRDLVGHFPSYKERNLILNIAQYIIEEGEIFERLEKTKELPLGRLSRKVKISQGFLEKWQDYIIAYTLIISNANYMQIQSYITIEIDPESSSDVVPFENRNDISHRGIAVKVGKKTAIILTSSGQFFKIKKSDPVRAGQEIHGFEKKGIRHYKFQILLGILFIMLLCGAAYKSYTKVSSTVIFTSTSQIKLQINRSNKVIYTHSATDKGKALIDSIKPLDKDLDECLKQFMEYAADNEMVPKDGFIITITGKALEYGDLEKTDEYIVDNEVEVEINNAGSLHNVYESVEIKRKDDTKTGETK